MRGPHTRVTRHMNDGVDSVHRWLHLIQLCDVSHDDVIPVACWKNSRVIHQAQTISVREVIAERPPDTPRSAGDQYCFRASHAGYS